MLCILASEDTFDIFSRLLVIEKGSKSEPLNSISPVKSKQARSELEIKLTRSLKFHLMVECPQFTPFPGRAEARNTRYKWQEHNLN